MARCRPRHDIASAAKCHAVSGGTDADGSSELPPEGRRAAHSAPRGDHLDRGIGGFQQFRCPSDTFLMQPGRRARSEFSVYPPRELPAAQAGPSGQALHGPPLVKVDACPFQRRAEPGRVKGGDELGLAAGTVRGNDEPASQAVGRGTQIDVNQAQAQVKCAVQGRGSGGLRRPPARSTGRRRSSTVRVRSSTPRYRWPKRPSAPARTTSTPPGTGGGADALWGTGLRRKPPPTSRLCPPMAFYGGLPDLLATTLVGLSQPADIIVAIGLDRWWPTEGTRRTGRRNTAQRRCARRPTRSTRRSRSRSVDVSAALR